MSIFKTIREKFQYWLLARALKRLSRRKRTMGYRQAASFGILYDASSEENYRQITLLVKDLQQDQKKVKTLGLVNLKKMPEYAFPKLTFEFCSPKDFAWDYTPKSQSVRDFIAQEYDVLIDLSSAKMFHLKYLAATSGAAFKVGRYHDQQVNIFDLMLQVNDDTPHRETIEHTIFYLKMINNDQPDINQ